MRLFKNIKGERIDPIAHTLKILERLSKCSDSYWFRFSKCWKKTRYATVIAYRYGSRGVHYILSKKNEYY